jgi:hypothetical protein
VRVARWPKDSIAQFDSDAPLRAPVIPLLHVAPVPSAPIQPKLKVKMESLD